MSEARVIHAAIVTELTEREQGVENSLSKFRTELIEFKNNVTAKCPVVIGDKLDTANRDNSSELGKIDDRRYRVEGMVAAATGPSASAGIQVNGNTDRVQAGLASASIGTDGYRHSVDRCGEQGDRERVGALLSQSGTYNNCNNDNCKGCWTGNLTIHA
jgi:hypothetical protein